MFCRSLGEVGLFNRFFRELNRCFESCFFFKMIGGFSFNRFFFDLFLFFVRYVLDSKFFDFKCSFFFFRVFLFCLDELK